MSSDVGMQESLCIDVQAGLHFDYASMLRAIAANVAAGGSTALI